MSDSNDAMREYEFDNGPKEEEPGEDCKEDTNTIICTVTVQSSPTWWSRSLTIPG